MENFRYIWSKMLQERDAENFSPIKNFFYEKFFC